MPPYSVFSIVTTGSEIPLRFSAIVSFVITYPNARYNAILRGTLVLSHLSLKIKEQLEWIASCNIDVILITCTNYIALLKEEQLLLSIPIKMDEPFFQMICEETQPQFILFTNPATVDGTMERLYQYAKRHKKAINVQVKVLDNTFDLIMQGNKAAYNNAIIQYFREIMNDGLRIAVAQLSMVEAAQQFEEEFGVAITHPLLSLVEFWRLVDTKCANPDKK
ncbi:Glutamate racemase OS=Lysinibacillus sphaericus OX=1421 GN=LS41612_01895 PE=4 SV=1 [Lysinibacillus sphaericus]